MSEASLSLSKWAARLGDSGYRVFPLKPGEKIPALKRWQHVASSDASQIEKWFPDGCTRNIGVLASERTHNGVPRLLAVIDLDVKNGVDGLAALQSLAAKHGGTLPDTFQVRTASGGWHLYFYVSRPVGSNAGKLAPGIDVRGIGGFVVGAGSVTADGSYTAENVPVVDCPAWLEELLPHVGQEAPRDPVAEDAVWAKVDASKAEVRAVEYLTTKAPEAIQGARGDETTCDVARQLRDFGVRQGDAAALMLEHWFDGCGWTSDELATKVDNAYRYAKRPPCADAPEAQFLPVEPETAPTAVGALHPFDELNREYALVIAGADAVVYHERKDLATGQRVFDRLKPQTFKMAIADRKFSTGDRAGPLADAWLKSPKRRIYDGGVEFAPNCKLPENILNLWGGFAVAPKPGDWSKLRAHIREIVTGGDAAVDSYVMHWLANMVQNPGEPGHVALVFRGERGTGKGTLGEMVGRLFGRHAIHLNDPQQLSGRFSQHLACRVFVLADEAVFVGAKSSEPRLKAMITERQIPLEAKGVDMGSVRNCMHIMMLSNDDWVVRAGARERRYCVVDVSTAAQQNIAYFGAIRDQMEHGGLEAMLHDLLHMDLSNFSVWAYPKTAAGTEQQTNSLPPPDRWVYEGLMRGWIAGQEWADVELPVMTEDAYQDYVTKKPRHEFEVAANAFSRKLQKIFESGGRALSRRQIARRWHLVFPPLATAREAFDRYLGAPVPWPDTGEGGEGPGVHGMFD